jgi:Flp pilus assembly secretin CpaC
MAGSGLLGSLIGMPDGIPGLSTLPIIGALF